MTNLTKSSLEIDSSPSNAIDSLFLFLKKNLINWAIITSVVSGCWILFGREKVENYVDSRTKALLYPMSTFVDTVYLKTLETNLMVRSLLKDEEIKEIEEKVRVIKQTVINRRILDKYKD